MFLLTQNAQSLVDRRNERISRAQNRNWVIGTAGIDEPRFMVNPQGLTRDTHRIKQGKKPGLFNRYRTRKLFGETIRNWDRPSRSWNRAVSKFVGSGEGITGHGGRAISMRGALKGTLKAMGTPMGLAFGPGIGFALGYSEGGLSGGFAGAAESTIMMAGFEMGARTLGLAGIGIKGGLALGGIGMAAAGVGYATHAALEHGNRYMRNRGKMELSAPTLDVFGTAATMRQRSLAAMNDSHINMRNALGNEAMYLHR